MRTTISIEKTIYEEMKKTAERDFISPSQLIRQLWRDYKIGLGCDTPDRKPETKKRRAA